MKFNIRHKIFETNSSSTHALSVYLTDDFDDIPEKISIDLSEYSFSWENETYNDTYSKLAYLLLIAEHLDYNDNDKTNLTKLKALILAAGVKELKVTRTPDSWEGYIDHISNAEEFFKDLVNEPALLYSFVFNTASIIETGNDNDDYMPSYENGCDYGYIKDN